MKTSPAKQQEKVNQVINKKFGRLTIVGEFESQHRICDSLGKEKIIYATILCKCDCGITKRINFSNVITGKTQSCGCFGKENSAKIGRKTGKINAQKRRKFTPEESSAVDLYDKYMKRNPGDLTYQLFRKLTKQNCFFCDKPPLQIYLRHSMKKEYKEQGKYLYNGLDRIDNSIGYNEINVVPCCKTCNFMRHILTLELFWEKIAMIVKQHKDKFIKFGIKVM